MTTLRDVQSHLAWVYGLILCSAILSVSIWPSSAAAQAQGQLADWQQDWAIEAGFSIEVDTEGYDLPTAIAFVPTPGPLPNDPLYFVTEMHGTLKVVTRDRSVHVFSDAAVPKSDGSGSRDTRMAGLCLAPELGYVFVTLIYRLPSGAFRNQLVRFATTPHRFSLQPTQVKVFEGLFDTEKSTGSLHQIGACQVQGDHLLVSLGDDMRVHLSQTVDTWFGKILRMTLDGDAVVNNPYFQDDGKQSPADYVFALGFRNPFGLKWVEQTGSLFTSDNGIDTDRFIRVQAGGNYLWNGADWSIGARATAVFAPGIAPAHVDYYPPEATFFPDQFQRHFFIASAGARHNAAGIIAIPWHENDRHLTAPPRYFLTARSGRGQSVIGLAFGGQALYFAPAVPDASGRSPILKIRYHPETAHPYTLQANLDPSWLRRIHGCSACHNRGEGPSLERIALIARIQKRLQSDRYRKVVAALDQVDQEPFQRYRTARQAVLAATGMQQVKLWLTYRLLEPRFDDPKAQMPNSGLNRAEAEALVNDLLGQCQEGTQCGPTRVEKAMSWLSRFRDRRLLIASGAAFILGMIAATLIQQRIRTVLTSRRSVG